MDARDLALIKQLREIQDAEDGRLDEHQREIMNQMIDSGMDAHEAKMRVLCIAIPPDHFKSVPQGHDLFPVALYHPDGRIKSAKDEKDKREALKAGWLEKPSTVHVETILQREQKRASIRSEMVEAKAS